MLDINYIRTNSEKIKTACKNKQLDASIVDQLLATDLKRRELQIQVDDLRKKSNEHVEIIKKAVQAGNKPTPEQIAKGKEIKTEIQKYEPELKEVQEEYKKLMFQVPNVPAQDVPVGKDESGNVVQREVGEKPKFDFEPKEHYELMENLGLLDTKRAVRVGGFRSYFLKNDALLLEQAVLNYALKLLSEAGFTPMSAPILVNEEVMWGTGYLPWGNEDHYKTQDDQFLAGTAEVALTAYRMGETLNEKELPYKMCGLSPCFRKEVGTYGKDTKGIIRVHQFNKVEQVVYTIADEEETRKWHEKMTEFSETLLNNLGLPYQVLLMCTGDMGAGQRKKYDIETWFPGQNKYRETHSASYFNDFQARRLNIKYQAKDGTTKYVYTLNNTMAATPRLLGAIIENYQQKDGSIKVPDVLQPYLGKDTIKN
ncbi:MAG: serine--tRNA ligase [Candidatus Pacebacteria bacterium CG_4_10_14_3_um_filter_34_15]|nr:MAG: serine--tRNA ligase [Candidatus Pacebacteria bacterium CG11_big_fil_rev_8_21_14_0_20_34_55]PIX81135.1 MAG: serine--tRNA ligase [Candidatus Pacebacteria bacterium CG_4_10_14_3_um_filter_34_15]